MTLLAVSGYFQEYAGGSLPEDAVVAEPIVGRSGVLVVG
jgi:hypothetical protein